MEDPGAGPPVALGRCEPWGHPDLKHEAHVWSLKEEAQELCSHKKPVFLFNRFQGRESTCTAARRPERGVFKSQKGGSSSRRF